MQLDLFEDNRPVILLNIADEYLRACDVGKALAVCEQVRDEYPGNRQAAELCELIRAWHGIIAGIEPSSCKPQQLREMLINLESVTHAALRSAIINTLTGVLQTFPESDHIFLPPRFHRGHLLLELGRCADAATSFRTALASPTLERGRFLAWSADAMTLSGKADDALQVYLQALLEDPATIDIPFVKHQTVQKLYQHCSLYAEGIEDDGEVAWLPVWGWLQGVFPLPLHHPPVLVELESRIGSKAFPTPRLWFELLTVAEHLRTVQRDDRQMAAVRRLMKRCNEEMFECYLLKIRGTRP
ncbi:MAG: tetratricopeptide repeat protein [Desulfuromonadales bacterium]